MKAAKFDSVGVWVGVAVEVGAFVGSNVLVDGAPVGLEVVGTYEVGDRLGPGSVGDNVACLAD